MHSSYLIAERIERDRAGIVDETYFPTEFVAQVARYVEREGDHDGGSSHIAASSLPTRGHS